VGLILLDTSAIYALADRGDPNHRVAVERLRQVEAQGHTLFVHSYILAESTALLQRRLGLAVALRFLEDARAFWIHWVIGRDHEEAVRLLASRGKPTLSLVDCVSFVLMRKYRITTAFAFDEDFEREGFQLLR
jgi:predicted nucleic acid-binding protein